MRLTALDIREQQFRRVMRGLDPDEVVTFLGAVASEYELLVSENRDLRQRLLDLEHQIGEFRSMEKALRDTLLTAERVTAETKENAQKEADLILRQAEVAAQQSTAHISSEILQKRRELHELQRKKKEYLLNVRALAASHLEMIESDARALESELSAAGVADAGAALPQTTLVPEAPAQPATDAMVPPMLQQTAVPSEVPTEAVGVIPSAVPAEAVDSARLAEEAPTAPPPVAHAAAAAAAESVVSSTVPLIAPPEDGWAEAAFEPGDLVPRDVEAPAITERTAEQYRRGIAPGEPLPALLRAPGTEAPATTGNVVSQPAPQVQNPLPEPPLDGDNNWPTHAVRPDGSRGE